jgi:Putative transposase/Transposase zinc-binding domain
MNASATAGVASSMSFHDVLLRWGPAYLERHRSATPARQRQVLRKILACRTPSMGGSIYACAPCGTFDYAYHSCNDRHCPQCGTAEAQDWLKQHAQLLLPVPYFMVTFTLPEPLRAWVRSHPKLGYRLLFECTARALQDLAANPKRLGAMLGMIGFLHTWSRTLIFHPHVHYLIPGGGLSLDQRQWRCKGRKFLLPKGPLADHFRTLFNKALTREDPQALTLLPAKIWTQRWVVKVTAAGSGQQALAYLSAYVFKTATGNRRVSLLPDGRLRWPYRNSRTRQWEAIPLEPEELIRRFLQHVSPAGLHRVRSFGWFHPAARVKLNRVRALLAQRPQLTPAEQAAWQLPEELAVPAHELEEPEPPKPTPLCPGCHQPMTLLVRWHAGHPIPWPRKPP